MKTSNQDDNYVSPWGQARRGQAVSTLLLWQLELRPGAVV